MGGRKDPEFKRMIRRCRTTVWTLVSKREIVYDSMWRGIMLEVSLILNMPVGDVERINTAWWKYVSEMMGRVELPVIRMVYLCTISPSVSKLYGYCDKMGIIIDRLLRGATIDNRKVANVDRMAKHLVKMQDAYFRIQSEKAKRKKKKGAPLTEEQRAAMPVQRRMIHVSMMEARELKKKLKLKEDNNVNNNKGDDFK